MITGPSGIGKSALALALMGRGATLISDDLTDIDDGIAYAPTHHRGWLEVRNIGLISGFSVCNQAPLAAEIRLTEEKPDRHPPTPTTEIPVFHLWAHDVNLADKVILIDKILNKQLFLE